MGNSCNLTRKTLEEEIEDFKKSQFKDKLNELNNKKNFPEDFLIAATDKACTDMMALTLKVKPGKGGKDFKNEINLKLKPEIIDYFNGANDYYKDDKFDEWHHRVCNDIVLPVINTHYDAKIKGDTEVKYGKAQKILNMTFKYLYCFADVETRKKYFKYCHMPIDSYILKWLEEDKNLKILNEMDAFKDLKLKKSKFSCWSNLQYCEDNKYYTYDTVCEMIRKLVEKTCGGKFTPLEAEFFIWKQMKEQAK